MTRKRHKPTTPRLIRNAPSYPLYSPTGTTTRSKADGLRKAMLSEAALLRDMGFPIAGQYLADAAEALPFVSFERIMRDA